MISEEQQKVFRKVLGRFPGHTVLNWMAQQKPPIVSRMGTAYSSAFLSRVINGKVGNPTIEDAIWKCVKEEIQVKIKERAEKLEILTNAKKLPDDQVA